MTSRPPKRVPPRSRTSERQPGASALMCCIALSCILFTMLASKAAERSPTPNTRYGASAELTDQLPFHVDGLPSNPEFWSGLRRGNHGETSLLDPKAGVLIQFGGQRWRTFRNEQLPAFGTWSLAGICLVLTLFYLVRGRIRIEAWFSGNNILRFNSLERMVHWLLASSFIILALTGLNMLYGRDIVKPLLGYVAFARVTAYGKWLHDFTGFAFIIGLVLVLTLWVRDNIPERHDLTWITQGGGLFSSGVHPPARRFNAGQKIVFWFVISAGAVVSFTGMCLLFPFILTPFSSAIQALNWLGAGLSTDLSITREMQLSHVLHSVAAIVMIVVLIAHAYIGSIGMEGTFDAMKTGYVDENWVREHHPLWAEELGLEPRVDTTGKNFASDQQAGVDPASI